MKSILTFLIGSGIILSNVFGGVFQKTSLAKGTEFLNGSLKSTVNTGIEPVRVNVSSCYILPNNPLILTGNNGNSANPIPGLIANYNTLTNSCCPKFILKDAIDICPPEGACSRSSDQGGIGNVQHMAACKNLAHTYTVYPNDPTFTYTWTITGGTPTSFTGNPITIVWGNGSTGSIKVVTSNFGVGGSCKDSIIRDICLIDGPKANFTVSSDTVCKNTPVHFSNTSLGGSVYHWDFGDGTTSNLANPPDHSYSAAGTYTVILTVIDMGSGQLVPTTQGETLVPCGCRDTKSKKIVVLNGNGPTINYDCCFGTVCAGDTSSFCTTMVCGTYAWSVTGGTIISGTGTSCIRVKWFATYSVPTTVSLQSCPGSGCPGSTTLKVPVLYPNLPVNGPAVLCVGASGTYTLPWLLGTYYKWTVSGGLYSFNKTDRNVTNVNISFNTPGPFWVKCVYNNPLAGCSGADSMLVNILPLFTITGDKTVCEGNPINYYANGPAMWNITPPGATIITGNGTSSIVASFAPGTYTITATPINSGIFCNPNAILKVDAKAKPILGNILGQDSVCPGKKLTYSITSNVSGSSFVWSITGGTGTINSQMGADNDSVVVEFSSPGPWVVNVYQNLEISPGVFCPSITKSLTVNPFLQPVITGPSPICVDATGTYSAGGSNPPGGYQWTISPPSRGTIQSGQGTNSVTILWHGPSSTAILSVSSCAGNFSLPVTVNGPPTALVTYNTLPVFCLGDLQTLILSTPAVGGYSYQWYKNTNPISGANSPTLNISIPLLTLPGTYQYYVMVTSNGCSSKSNLINVVIDDCTPGQPGGGPLPGSCDALAYFKTYVVCDKITLVNQSTVVPPSTITNYQWTISGPGTGTFTPNANSANPLLSVSASASYTITLTVTSSSGCTSTWTAYVNVLLPVANFTYTTPVCQNSIAFFTAIPNNPSYNYNWAFGDGATSYTALTQHAYSSSSPPPFTDSLTIKDAMGCIAKVALPITVNPTPNCTITASDTIFCPGSFVTLTACSLMSSYQWYKDGNAIGGATSMIYTANKHGEYWVAVTNGFGCPGNSNKIYIYMNSLPKAKITGERYTCIAAGGTATVALSTPFNANYLYNWSSIPAGATFSPANSNATTATLTLPLTLPITYQFIVNVSDNITGCFTSDTMCVTFYETPSLSVTNFNVCEGTNVTLTPTPNNTVKFSYQWNNGAVTPVIIASAPGLYSLTMTDKATGCPASAIAGTINPKPDLSLFPLGCKQLCNVDTLHLYIPLPLNALYPNNTYPNSYPIITWYDNGNYATPIGNGQNLAFPGNTPGNHQIFVVVANNYGCSDTAGVFCASNDLCCKIILENIVTGDASCPEASNGWFTIILNPASIGGPFTITSSPLVPPMPTTITAGIPFTVSNLPPGTYIITISSPSGNCVATYNIVIGHKKEGCCFAEIDPLFHKITSNITYTSDVVWDGKYYIDDNVIVTVSGATLDITTMDVVFGDCAGIDFVNGGHLRASNSVFRPCKIDGSWRGLKFIKSGIFDNIINESTFKNAEVALYFKGPGTDGVVSNNLFSNCRIGVLIDNNNNFDHPISGNQFVTDQFFPVFKGCYSFINNSSTYGIYSSNSKLMKEVSQNGFVNAKATSLPQTYGIYQYQSGGLFSANTFTDQTYSIFLNSPVYPSNIENNNIELNVTSVAASSCIYIDNSNTAVVEINNNEISNNFHKSSSNSAIYCRYSSNVSIVGNRIDGFSYGLIANSAKKFQISNNVIVDPEICGIYFSGTGSLKSYITCNSIKMRSFTNTKGMYILDLPNPSEISSNCITDCYTSINITSSAGGLLPKIRNNYLYNYKYAGINSSGYSGNIGTLVPADPGLNTLWSNCNTARDINSNTNIVVADNFGMFNISFPQVQIVSNRPYCSTASCGHQIYNMPSQGNLNINYTCDNYSSLLGELNKIAGRFDLNSNYYELLQSSGTQFDDVKMILACLDNPDVSLLNELISLTSLTDNEKYILKYNYYYSHNDLVNARLNINNFSPGNSDETDYKYLRLVDLDILENGWTALQENTIQELNSIEAKETINSNFAISILNNSPTYRGFIFENPVIFDAVNSDNSQHISDNESYLHIYPNPASEKVFIEIVKTDMLNGKIKIFDVNGKLVTDYKLNFVAGGIELDIQNLRNGLYFVSLTDDSLGLIQTGKLIKN